MKTLGQILFDERMRHFSIYGFDYAYALPIEQAACEHAALAVVDEYLRRQAPVGFARVMEEGSIVFYSSRPSHDSPNALSEPIPLILGVR